VSTALSRPARAREPDARPAAAADDLAMRVGTWIREHLDPVLESAATRRADRVPLAAALIWGVCLLANDDLFDLPIFTGHRAHSQYLWAAVALAGVALEVWGIWRERRGRSFWLLRAAGLWFVFAFFLGLSVQYLRASLGLLLPWVYLNLLFAYLAALSSTRMAVLRPSPRPREGPSGSGGGR
jgi:hypothetical protein